MEPPAVYFSRWGPLDGPILGSANSPAIGVHLERERTPGAPVQPPGMAFPFGLVAHRKGPAQTFRLLIGGTELEGRWICVARTFIRLGEAAEDL